MTDPPGQGDASVLNYWVIPDFRPTEETTIDGWCRKTAAIRDLLLSGQRQAAYAMVTDRPARG